MSKENIDVQLGTAAIDLTTPTVLRTATPPQEGNFDCSPSVKGCLPKADGVVNNVVVNNVVVNKRNSQNYFSLPYNPKLRERAKELRKAGNLAEVLLWNQLKKKQFKLLDFDRQKIIGNYIVDFYCPNCNVVIEIDGNSHNDKEEYDALRDAFLEGHGLTIIHIIDIDVKKNMDGVMKMLNEHPAFNII